MVDQHDPIRGILQQVPVFGAGQPPGPSVMFGVLIVIGFTFPNWSILRSLARRGEKRDVRGITDDAELPLGAVSLSHFAFF